MDTFEIKDDEINVEEIMAKIRENIRRRKEAGIYPQYPDPGAMPISKGEASSKIARDLSYLSGNWDIHNNSYFISSHRPITGKVLMRGRELVHGEVRRYVDPMIWKQAEFNRATARVLEEINRQVSRIEGLQDRINEIQPEIPGLRRGFDLRLKSKCRPLLQRWTPTSRTGPGWRRFLRENGQGCTPKDRAHKLLFCQGRHELFRL